MPDHSKHFANVLDLLQRFPLKEQIRIIDDLILSDTDKERIKGRFWWGAWHALGERNDDWNKSGYFFSRISRAGNRMNRNREP